MEKERKLITETLNGNLSSFDQLMQKYQADVFLTVNRMIDNPQISYDICQNIFIKVFNNLNTFRFKCAFKTWLLKISVNETFSWIRRNRKRFDQISIDYENEDEVKDPQKNLRNYWSKMKTENDYYVH